MHWKNEIDRYKKEVMSVHVLGNCIDFGPFYPNNNIALSLDDQE